LAAELVSLPSELGGLPSRPRPKSTSLHDAFGISGKAHPFRSLRVAPTPRPRRNSWPRDDEAKTRWPNGNARTLPLVYRIRSEFRNRKLQETRSRCRLIERRIEPRATRIVERSGHAFFRVTAAEADSSLPAVVASSARRPVMDISPGWPPASRRSGSPHARFRGVRTQARQGWCFRGRLPRDRGPGFIASQLRYA
jgi:hypothetical protein